MRPLPRILLLLVLLLALALPHSALRAQQPPHVAPTDALAPHEQQAKFQLPAGFEIQLVASDPDIGQPMNLAFDARGGLWVTHSVEYPYPAQADGVEPRSRFAGTGDHPPRDRLTILNAIGPDGRAQQVRHFAEGLNIPIGQAPLGDGSSALVYSIPAIFRCTDTDGDGKSDKREEVYGRFGNIDTHGMSNSYTPWVDGWFYGCHGFSNHSVIRDAAGNTTDMTSGNTYRFQADGSRFEPFTFGQVNPFGMAFDPLGNLYNADCHSMPVTMLLRGATYPHFGNAAGPLGFGPTMINHNHGSTGICGVAYYEADHFPPDFRGNLFICNPVTGWVHRDKLQQFGSTYQIDTQPDFIRCDDPWFRPVDAMLGPDGALYIADFYNAVIGHYEVPLEHPKRDRTHGRVWRVVYRGTDGKHAPEPPVDLAKLDTGQLAAKLGDVNLLVRTQATNLLVSAHAKHAAAVLREALDANHLAEFRAHGLWVIERLDGLSDAELARLAEDPDRLVRVHLIKAVVERPEWTTAHHALVQAALADEDPFVCRAAADALGRHPQAGHVAPLLAAWSEAADGDTHLVYTVKLALRSHFESADIVNALAVQNFPPDSVGRLMEIASSSTGDASAAFLLRHARPGELNPAILKRAVPQVARHGTPEQVTQLIRLIRESFSQDPSRQFALFRLVYQGLAQRGARPEQHAEARNWFVELAPQLLEAIVDSADTWTNQPLPDLPDSSSPWGVRDRKCTDGQTIQVLDSIAHGEPLTGVYRSRAFEIPAQLSFWMCGHNGPPGTNPPPVNHVRLRLLDDDQIVASEVPPRNDIARSYTWNLQDHVGKQGVFEIVDANTLSAYAWIAVGRFDPPLLSVPGDDSAIDAPEALAMMGRFELQSLLPQLLALAAAEEQPDELRIAAATTAPRLGGQAQALPILAQLLARPQLSETDSAKLADALAAIDTDEARNVLTESLAQAPATLQRAIALALCNSASGSESLLAAIHKGRASARLLQDREVENRFRQRATPESQRTAKEIVEGLPSVEQRLLDLIAERRAGYHPEQTSSQRGLAVFTKHCAICHKVGAQGKTVGPQLDGIGLRGVDRLLEDMIDPNRNVDAIFRSVTIVTQDGRILTGLRRREEGQVLVIADQQGKEIEIPADEIDEIKPANLSLMPANLVESLKPGELHDLLTYLLSLQTKVD